LCSGNKKKKNKLGKLILLEPLFNEVIYLTAFEYGLVFSDRDNDGRKKRILGDNKTRVTFSHKQAQSEVELDQQLFWGCSLATD